MANEIQKYKGLTLLINRYNGEKTKVFINETKHWGFFKQDAEGKWRVDTHHEDLKSCEDFLNGESQIKEPVKEEKKEVKKVEPQKGLSKDKWWD